MQHADRNTAKRELTNFRQSGGGSSGSNHNSIIGPMLLFQLCQRVHLLQPEARLRAITQLSKLCFTLLPHCPAWSRLKLEPFLNLCVSSLREDLADLVCIVPIVTDVTEVT